MPPETQEIASPPPAVSTRQHTVGGTAHFEGLGLLLGEPVTVDVEPAEIGHGIVFERTDLESPVRIPAIVDHVVPRGRRTALRSGEIGRAHV